MLLVSRRTRPFECIVWTMSTTNTSISSKLELAPRCGHLRLVRLLLHPAAIQSLFLHFIGTSFVIADFTGMIRPATTSSVSSLSSFTSSSFISLGAQDIPGEMQCRMEHDMETTNWKKAKYNAEWKECIMTRAGIIQ